MIDSCFLYYDDDGGGGASSRILGMRGCRMCCVMMQANVSVKDTIDTSSDTHIVHPQRHIQAAEMEAADDFVEQMAWLSYLDECDEAARSSFSGFGKRWAARRRVGLIKVHPPRQYNADDDSRGSGGRVRSVSVTETALVTYTPRIFEVKPRKLTSHSLGVPKNVKGMQHGHRGRYYSAAPRTHY